MSLVIRRGRLVDPASGRDEFIDLRVRDGVVAFVASDIEPAPGERTIDASGCIVTPGWIDAHVHLRDPGFPEKEDLTSGAEAALAGGFTRVCCMPNTNPPLDTAERVRDIVERGSRTGVAIHPIGTITVGRKLTELAPLREMAAAGAVGFSDDGESTRSVAAMREALLLSTELNLPIMVHCEDPDLIAGGSMHRGVVSQEIGDPGIPANAEESYIERDIELARQTGGWLHVLHISTARGAELLYRAKQAGLRVTGEVMPHHLALTDEWVAGRKRFVGEGEPVTTGEIDPNAKVNPPLRPETDAISLIDALRRGVFDFLGTDHAPHAPGDKQLPLSRAAFGMSGLELAIPTMTRLIERGALDWPLVVDMFTARPARVLHLPGGRIDVGDQADITIIDPGREWIVEPDTLRTRSKNTPLLGLPVRGKAVMTIVRGEIRHDELSRR